MHKLSSIIYPLLVCAFSVRFLWKGADVADACLAVALVALIAVQAYLEAQRKPIALPMNDQVLAELADLKSTVNALRVGRAFGKM